MKIGINGLGRIGRTFLKIAILRGDLEIVGINDPADNKTLAHLLKYDSIHGKFSGEIKYNSEGIFINGHFIPVSHEHQIENINWVLMGVQMVIESSGHFLDRTSSEKHLQQGAQKVLLSAPPKDNTIKSVVLGVNEGILSPYDTIVSNASCTTNSAAPMLHVLNSIWQVHSAYISTVHSYTGDQRLIDAPHHDLRRARAAALSIIPTTTGAAKAITKIFPELEGKVGGGGIRVPVPDGSLTDITVVLNKTVSEKEVIDAFKDAAFTYLKHIMEFTEDPIVSSDIIGNTHSVIFDAQLTSVVGPMVKVVGWYDNETGYSNRLYELAKLIGRTN